MKFRIGENLKRLRQMKGLTQEEAAEVFGVSGQAVSRWENNSAYPDITLLPGIAMFYDTSVDAIVGMDEIRREETIRKIHTEINRLVVGGQIEEAVELIRDSLKVYPNDSGLLMSLGETLAHQGQDPSAVAEAISIAERVLENTGVSMKAKATTTVNLLFLYLRSGREDKAAELVSSLPHIWESREIIMAELHEGNGYQQALKAAMTKALVFFCQKIDMLPERRFGTTPEYIQLGVDFTQTKEIDEMLNQLREFLNK